MKLSVVVDVLESLLDGVCVDTALLQLTTQHRARESLAPVTGFHPQAREGDVIDKPNLLEPVQYSLACIGICSTPTKVFAQFVARARSTR